MRGLQSDTTSSPSDTTALLGQNVMLSCTYPPSNSSFLVKWSQVQTNGTIFDIFISPATFFSNALKPGKFALNGSYNLVISNVNFADAGTYGCQYLDSLRVINKWANLIVIGKNLCS